MQVKKKQKMGHLIIFEWPGREGELMLEDKNINMTCNKIA
jgi:hypothetical protein